MSEDKRTILTGAWERQGQYGPFFTGNVKKSDLIKMLEEHGENLQLVVAQVGEKKTPSHPDILVSVRDNNYEKKA